MAHLPPHKTPPDDTQRTHRPRVIPSAAAKVAAFLALLIGAAAHAQAPVAPASCSDWRAELLAVEGDVQVQRSGSSEWTEVVQGDLLCRGDAVRVEAFSSATVRLPDQSVIRLDEHTTLTMKEPEGGIGSLIEVLRGVIHVISRDPRQLRFTTPHANAGLKGTEFDIRVSEADNQTQIAVLEGAVTVTSPAGEIEVPSGHVASAREGEMPSAQPVAEPIELMRWASYFPPILEGDSPSPDQEPLAAQRGDPAFFTGRAAARLRHGKVAPAEADLESALRLAPGDSTALALRSIVALGRNDIATARNLALGASRASPPSTAAWIALSHVLQADGDLDGAFASASSATAQDPQNAIAWARRAELELGLQRFDDSLQSAMRAIGLHPSFGYAHCVLGFVELTRLEVGRAITAFEDAISMDQASPLPHIGLALALIQRGDFVAGRQQLELAVALDPANALTRSYMGKTYDAENRTKLPGAQLELAKHFAPNDPTPWLYGALVKLNRNRPVEAFEDLLGAISRNDNRALFRSTLAMDADLATRSAGLGSVLRELGFEQLAFVRGWAATEADPTDYAGHRFLADVYAAAPRHELARVSELLTSQLLQPANLTPLQPQLAQVSFFPVNRTGPNELAFNALSPLLTSNGLRFEASSVVAANETFGEDVVLAGLHDRLSYSVGQFHYSTDGFRENSDFDQTMANAFVQFSPNERTGIQAELRSSDTEHGDLARYFDPARFNTSIRSNESVDVLRVGGRRQLSNRDTLIGSLLYQDVGLSLHSEFLEVASTGDAYGADIQHIHEGARWNVRSGVLYSDGDLRDTTTTLVPGAPPETLAASAYQIRQTSAYAYANLGLTHGLTVTLGAAADSVREALVERDEVNPKIGVTWTPTERITVRAASFETLQGTLTTSKQNPQARLEPVQVAGFNQLLLGGNADASTVHGVGVDGRLAKALFSGVEVVHRDTESYIFNFDPLLGAFLPTPTESSEDNARAYLYWTPRSDLSFSAQYRNEKFEAAGDSPYGFTHMQIRRLPLEARYFWAKGLTASLRLSRLEQSGEFVVAGPPTGPEGVAFGEDRFWLTDASVGYRLPNRRGVLSFNVDNLFDKDFLFQDVDPDNPSVIPERFAYFRFTLSFE